MKSATMNAIVLTIVIFINNFSEKLLQSQFTEIMKRISRSMKETHDLPKRCAFFYLYHQIVKMEKENFRNKWVSCITLYYQDKFQTIDNTFLVHPDFHSTVKNQLTTTIFQCVSVDNDYLELKAGQLILQVKPEAIKQIYPDPKFQIDDLVSYHSSKKGKLTLKVSQLIWHEKEQAFYFFALLNDKAYKKRFSESELSLVLSQ